MSAQAGGGFTRLQLTSVMSMGIAAGCIPALQPLLLGGLLHEGRLTAAQIGQAATVEALGMALAMTVAALVLRPVHLKPLASVTALLALAANLATTAADGFNIVLARGFNGLCSGLLLWLLIGLFARAAVPGRLFAVYVTAQAIGAFVLSSLFTTLLIPRFGVTGGYATLAAFDLALVGAAVTMPPAYPPLAGGSGGGRPPAVGLLALLGVGSYLAGVLAFWVYVAPLAEQLGHARGTVNLAITVAIGVQIAGGLCASLLATRLSALSVCVAGALVSVVCILLFLGLPSGTALFLSAGVFSFFWMFVPPFQMPLLIQADPSMRAAMLVGSAQLLGCAIGPMLASQFVGATSLSGASTVAIAFFALSLGSVVSAILWARQRAGRGGLAAATALPSAVES